MSVNATRLFIGGPFDAKFKRFELKSWEDSGTAYKFDYDPNEYMFRKPFDNLPINATVEQHNYFPFEFWQYGKVQHIIMRHGSISDKDLISVILKGYIKECLHKD